MEHDLSKLTANELDELIGRAAALRSRMSPELPGERPTQDVLVTQGLQWHVAAVEAGMVIQIGHPGFGWLNLGFSHADRVQMLTAMLQQALLDPQKAGPPAPAVVPVEGGETEAGGGSLH